MSKTVVPSSALDDGGHTGTVRSITNVGEFESGDAALMLVEWLNEFDDIHATLPGMVLSGSGVWIEDK